MDRYVRAWISSPFKKPEPRKKPQPKLRERCENLTDDGVKFGCAIFTGFKVGDCSKCGFYKAAKGAWQE